LQIPAQVGHAPRRLRAALVAFCAACGSRGPSAGSSDSLYIGLAVTDAPDPSSYRRGAALALESLNATRTPEQLPFGIREPPAAATTPMAIAAALRDDPDVIGVVGHARDAVTQAAAAGYAGRRPVVVISPTSRDEATAHRSDWIFRLAPPTAAVAEAIARYAADSVRAPRAALIYPNDASGRDFGRAFGRAYGEVGGLLIERDPYLVGDRGAFEPYALRLAGQGAAGAVVVAGTFGDILALVTSAAAASLDADVLGAPEPWDRVQAIADSTRRVHLASAFDAERPQTPAAAEFIAVYSRLYGAAPDARAALTYDAAMLIGLAVRDVGVDRWAVRDWIARTGRGRPAHAGASGSILFDGFGNPVNRTVLLVGPRLP